MIRLRPSGADEVLIKRVRDWYEPGPGVFITSTSTSTLFSPAMLFSGDTNGAWYDPSDLTTLFQDAAGTTPVTAVEQPVGLMLDKSKGLVLGSELVTNGGFDTDTGWTKQGGWTISGGNAVVNASNVGITIYQTASIAPNVLYDATVVVSSITSGSLAFSIGNGTQKTLAVGTNKFRISAGSGDLLIRVVTTSPSTAGSVDSVSVKQVTGNHAFNSSGNSANFPVLSARYNLLTKTEQFDESTVWERSSGNGGSVPVVTADYEAGPFAGTLADRVQLVRTTQTASFSQLSVLMTSLLTIGVTYTASVWMKSRSGSVVVDMGSFNGNYGSYKPTVTTEWQRFSYQWTVTTTASRFGPLVFQTTSTSETADLLVWGADLRVSNDALNQPAYQRVNTATDYDTVGFKPYLKFNGVNQWLQTNSIDFTYGDKMFVCAGVRKLSDASPAIIAELSVLTNNNNGAFFLAAPGDVNEAAIRYSVKGSLQTTVVSPTAYASPITSILSGIGDISGDSAILRINGPQVAISTADQGTGNYGNYPLYIGARAGSSLWFNGRLYGLVVAGKSTSASEISNTETYLNQKTGAY